RGPSGPDAGGSGGYGGSGGGGPRRGSGWRDSAYPAVTTDGRRRCRGGGVGGGWRDRGVDARVVGRLSGARAERHPDAGRGRDGVPLRRDTGRALRRG